MNVEITYNFNLEENELRVYGLCDCFLGVFEDSERRMYLTQTKSKTKAMEMLKDKKDASYVYVDKHGLVKSKTLYEKTYDRLLFGSLRFEKIVDNLFGEVNKN